MKPKKRIAISAIIFAVVLSAGAVGVGLFSHGRNQDRVNNEIRAYAEEISVRNEKHLSDVFENHLDTVKSLAYLYGHAMASADPDLELLGQLEKDSGFDWIRFIDENGDDYTSEGAFANVADRPYFISGMSGVSGLTSVSESRVNGQRLIGCYSPIYYQDRIEGVMVGFLKESTVHNMLSTIVYGYNSVTLIVDKEGTILGDTGYQPFTMEGFLTILPEGEKAAFVNAYQNLEAYSFDAHGQKGFTVGNIRPIAETGWSLVQLFPPEAYSDMISSADRDAFLSIAAVACLVAVVAVLAFRLFYSMRKMSLEVERHRERETLDRARQHDYDIIQGLARIYSAVYYIDVGLDNFERVFSDVPAISSAIPKKGNATLTFEFFANEFVYPEFTQQMLAFTNLKTLPERLQNVNLVSIEFQELNGDPSLPRVWSEASFIPVKRDSSGKVTHVLFAVANIEERKAKDIEYTNNLRAALAKAEAASVAKSTFLSNMSHDIRTPMNAVLGFTALAEASINDKEKLREYLHKIAQSGDGLLDLLNNVLELSRIESGRVEVVKRPSSLEDLNASIITTFEVEMSNKNLLFHYQPSFEHRFFWMDMTKMRQILINIFSNAIKYTPSGGAITYRVNEYVKEGKTFLEFVVSDSGIGMSKEFLPHLFDRFEREENQETKGIRGTGLGMAIVKKLVEAMGGEINVDSVVGRGTNVILNFPVERAEEKDVVKATPEENPVAEARYEGRRALMAEDNALNAEIAREMLLGRGLEVEWVEDGLEAFHAIQNHPADYYDIVLLDIQMPKMDGYACATAIRGIKDPIKSKLPIIAMTANAFDEDVRHSLAAGMNEHLGKPLSSSALDIALHRFLSNKK